MGSSRIRSSRRRTRTPSSLLLAHSTILLASSSSLCLLVLVRPAFGHGYLSKPRSRNLLAFEETVWWPLTENDPEPETCPHCLNRGGSLARCGMIDSPGVASRNYDSPKNALGGPMPVKIQETYVQGSEIELGVTLTAHHKGHFVFSACPISQQGGLPPSQSCFDSNKLTFVEDMLHGANYDPNYPERAYIAPMKDPHYVPVVGRTTGVMDFSFKMKLPMDLYGDLVLIQWYYLTANSCYHEGYQDYDWPASWNIQATSSMPCGGVSSDGNGTPELFWNCAEVRILPMNDGEGLSGRPPAPNPPVLTTPAPVQDMSAGIAIPVGLPSSDADAYANANNDPAPVPSSAGSHGKTIVGYYASWQWYDRQKLASPENMDFAKVQRVNFAFFQNDAQGNMWGTDSWADPNLLFGPYNWNPGEGSKKFCSWDGPNVKNCNHHDYERGLIHLVHAAGAEIYPSLGGWTMSDPFPAMAASAPARAKFAQNCVDLIREYGFDGIDIDWEYPGFEDHSGTPQDRDNFRLLLNDVRARLDQLGGETGKFYGLTAALPCGPRHINNMDIAHVASTLSELNLMTYDFHGAWSETSGVNAPLYPQGWGEDDFDVDSCVRNWLAGGGSRDKINIGLPFYGRSVLSATGMNQAHGGADKTNWEIDDGTPQYFNIVAKLPSMTSVWDKTTWTRYAYFDNGGLVSFDDENAICAKVQYAIENDLGGFIIWELSGDVMDDLSTPLLDVTNKKLNDPNFVCGEPGFYPEQDDAASPPVTSGTSPGIVVPEPDSQAAPSTPWGVPPSPITFPTHSVVVSTSDDLDPSGPEGNQPVNNGPANNQPNQPVDDQPVDVQPLDDQPVHIQPVLLLCDDRKDSFNADDSRAVELSFRYEMHRHPRVSEFDAMKEVKGSLLNRVAEKLKCDGTMSEGRGLRSNPLEASQKHVLAIESTESDLPDKATPCEIEVVLKGPAVCHSVIGSISAQVDKDASTAEQNQVSEELLFFIRTSMAAGFYESPNIAKVIYVGNLNPPLGSNAAPAYANVVWKPQSEEGPSSMFFVVLCFLVVVLVGIVVFALIFVARKQREERRIAEECTSESLESKPDDFEAPAMQISSTEESRKRSLAAEETWKKALHTYADESSKVTADPEGEALHPNVGSGTGNVEPSVEETTREGELPLEHDDGMHNSIGHRGSEDLDYKHLEPVGVDEIHHELKEEDHSQGHDTDFFGISEIDTNSASDGENTVNEDKCAIFVSNGEGVGLQFDSDGNQGTSTILPLDEQGSPSGPSNASENEQKGLNPVVYDGISFD